MKHLRILMLLMMIGIMPFTSYSQEKGKLTAYVQVRDSLVTVLADYNAQGIELIALQDDTTAMGKEIRRKENVILKLIADRNKQSRIADTCMQNNELKRKIINNLTETVVSLQNYKEKRWGVAVQVGAGASKSGLGPVASIGISYNIIRFKL